MSDGINTDTSYKDLVSDITESVVDDSVSDVSESFTRSLSGKLTKIARTSSLAFQGIQADSGCDGDDPENSVKGSSPKTSEACTEEYAITVTGVQARSAFKRSYHLNKRKSNLSKIPLPQSAASFYNGYSPRVEIVESCDSVERLNSYLKATRDEVNAGAPGKFLHAVIGQDVSDIATIVSTILYAFYFNEILENNQFCTVPVINMKRADLNAHAEVKWLLDSCQIDQSLLIFIDEIDLSYYDLFGSLKLVLLNGPKIPTRQEALKGAVVEVFNCRKAESTYPWVKTVSFGEDCSCCTLIAEKFALISPEILAGQAFSRLLLAGILLGTANLTSPHCTIKDKYMATLLINGAGRFGCNGLYQILKHKMYDVSELKAVDILRKDFKKWTRLGKSGSMGSGVMVTHIGMSSIGIPIEQLLSRENKSTYAVRYFLQLEKLRLLIIVSGYYDPQKNFKREIMIAAESVELMKSLLFFFNANSSQLPLKNLHLQGLREDMRAFQIDKVTSRRTIEGLLEEFDGTSNNDIEP